MYGVQKEEKRIDRKVLGKAKDKRISGVGDKSRVKEIGVSMVFHVGGGNPICIKTARDFAQQVSPGNWFQLETVQERMSIRNRVVWRIMVGGGHHLSEL